MIIVENLATRKVAYYNNLTTVAKHLELNAGSIRNAFCTTDKGYIVTKGYLITKAEIIKS